MAALLAMVGVLILVTVVAYSVRVSGDKLQRSIDDRQCEHALIADRQSVVAEIAEIGISILIELHDGNPDPVQLAQMTQAREQMLNLRQQLDALNVDC